MGWDEEREGVWFDADEYSEEEAQKQFKPFKGITDRGFPYTGYEFDGQKYHDFQFLGTFEDDEMPKSDKEWHSILLKKLKGE